MTNPTVSEVVHQFWKKTSIKGIPKALQSPTIPIRIFWGITTLCCFAMLLFQVGSLLARYYQFLFSINAFNANKSPDFPDVTICNLNPYDAYLTFDRTYEEYMDTLLELRKKTSESTDNFFDNKDDFWNDLQSPLSYIASQKMFHGINPLPDNNTFVTDCTWYTWNWNPYSSGKYDNDCKAAITTFWDPDFYRCYNFKPPTNPLMGFSTIIYVDNFPPSPINSTRIRLGTTMSSGIRLYIHPPNTYPLMRFQGFSLSPGTETTISLAQTILTHLPPPYGTCTGTMVIDPTDPDSFAYQQRTCQTICRQQVYVDICGCVVQYEGFTDKQLEAVNYTTCGSLMLNPNNETDVLKILEKPKCDYYYWPAASLCVCPKPCYEMRFDQTITNANTWPTTARQLSFYNTYIKPYPEIYGNKFATYGHIADLANNMTADEITASLRATGIIERNFIQLNIQFTQNNKVISNDVPSVTWDTLFATLGGALNLWMGITILFAAEVMELVFSIFKLIFSSKGKKTDPEIVDIPKSKSSTNLNRSVADEGIMLESIDNDVVESGTESNENID